MTRRHPRAWGARVVGLVVLVACQQPAGSNGRVAEPPLNEPPAMVRVTDQPWNTLRVPLPPILERLRDLLFPGWEPDTLWSYLRRTSAADDDIVTDPTAPHSPPYVLRIVYTPGCCANAEPSVHWIRLPAVQEAYTAWWMKLSDNWIPNPAGGGKMTFLWTTPQGQGQVYTNLYHRGGDAVTGWIEGPPYRVGANTEWAPYGTRIWLPNVAATGINPGEWHRIEFYYKWGTAGDGIIRWWVDGELNGDYTGVIYPPALGFNQFEFAPTVQFAGPQTRYLYVDHTIVSIP